LTNSFGQVNLRDSYFTIAAQTHAEIKIERSRFIATALPVESKAAAEAEYRTTRKHYHDATHNCFAYVVGIDPETSYRYSDDGEPSGTAGKPIHEAILGHQLTNMLLVVTRYFGGVKLGTGGLSRAYREAANQVLDQAHTRECFVMQIFKLRFAHDQVSAVMKVMSDFNLKPISISYAESVEVTAAIRRSGFEQLRATVIDRCHGRVEIELIADEA